MKKMTKLLSVILAFVMVLSCMTMMASAATTNYKTVEGLEGMGAYSPYGTVSRLTTEERLDIAFDSLDGLLASLNINLGTIDIKVGKLVIDLTSVDNLCKTISSIKDNQGLLNAAGNLSWLGIDIGMLKELTTSTWPDKQPTRAGSGNLVVASELLEFLTANQSLIESLFSSGINLGKTVSGFVDFDLSGINGLITDIPGTVNGLVLPILSRPDDNTGRIDILKNKKSNLIDVLQDFVNGLFTRPMNWTSYRTDEAGNDLHYTAALPTAEKQTSRYFVISADKKEITQFDYKYNGLLDTNGGVWKETVTYTKTQEGKDSTTYVYKAPEGYSGDQTLKWYKSSNPDSNGRIQSPYWLPSLADGSFTIDLNGADSVLGLIYEIAPKLFREMAPTVLNGSVKKLLAGAFGVEFTFIGKKGSADLATAIAGVTKAGDFFTKDQEFYVWEYSDYKVIDGVPYYRFQDDFYKGTLPKDLSAYYSMFNWDWNITDDFIDEFIPTGVGTGKWALDGLNDLVAKAINTVIKEKWTVKGEDWSRSDVFNWTKGGNDKLLNNLMVCAREFFKIAPEEIVDEYFTEAQFYNAMMNGTMKQAVNGLVCELVKLIMPQIKFPDNIVDQPITAIAAIVVRELCTQLMPSYNFDAMIYSNYGDSEGTKRAIIAGKSADYWLDTTLYMGVNLGMYYIRNLADIGEDAELGYYKAMANAGALPAATADGMTFGANAQYVGTTASWLYLVDWVVDWALTDKVEWAWNFDKLVNCGDTVDLETYQNPLKKLDTILCDLLPFKQLINVSAFETEICVYGSDTFLERVLKNGFIDSIVALDVNRLQSLFEIPNGYFTQGNMLNSVVKIVVNLLDKILYKVAGNANIIDPNTIDSLSAVLNQTNIKTIVGTLVGKLKTAYDNGLLVTVLPVLNMFIGWTTDAQKYADPTVVVDTGGAGYITVDATTGSGTATLKIRNSAAGMLLKHRTENVYDGSKWSTVKDVPYYLDVLSVTTTDTGMTLSKTTVTDLAPGESDNITLTTTSDKIPSKITVTYQLKGKNGDALGGQKTVTTYTYATKTQSDIIQTADKQTEIKGRTSAIDCVIFDFGLSTKNLLVKNSSDMRSYIEDLNVAITNQRDTACTITYVTYDGYDSSLIATNTDALAPYQNDKTTIAKKGDPNSTMNARVALLNPSFDLTSLKSGQTFALGKAKAQLYGEYKRPIIGSIVSTHGTSNDLYFGTLYYVNAAEFDKLYNDEIDKARVASDYTAESWATYEQALLNATAFHYEPITIATFANYTDDAIKAQKDALQAAVDGLKTVSSSSVTAASVEKALTDAEDQTDSAGNPREINFQNYQLFEYFKYEAQRTAARNLINAFNKPVEPTPYIENDSASYDIISAVKAAQTNSNISDGIEATLSQPDKEAMDNYNKAVADWKAPNYSAMQIADTAEKVTYYRQFLIEKKADNTFLNKEIAYAGAQGYNAADYSADSWTRYSAALANAQAVAAKANALESEVFDAKYELMVAQNKLQLKERSMKEVGYMNEELVPLIDKANVILNNFGTSTSLYTLKANAGVTDAEALGQLVRALGIKYDVEIDGKTQEGILYDRSALTFTEYDRTATAKNKKAVDMAADKLRAAIENFVCTAVIESNNNVTTVDQGVRYVQGIVPNSIPTKEALLEKLKVTGGTPVVTASKAGQFGTGTRIDLKSGNDLLATYFVVIYGDVNGDGAVDAFDALEVDYANCSAHYMGGVYDDAADLDGDGAVTDADYSALVAGVQCKGTISQVH